MIQKENNPKLKRGLYYEYSDNPDSLFVDWIIAEKSISDLKELKKNGKPFFMSIGFIRPHLPLLYLRNIGNSMMKIVSVFLIIIYLKKEILYLKQHF